MLTRWFECTVEVPVEYSEIVANFLIDSGAPGLQSEDRGGFTQLTGYFSSEPPIDTLLRLCADIGCPLGASQSIRVREVAHEDWAENWKAHFRPQPVGNQLCICPPWDCTPPAGRVAVVINPGMAFGTGHHATTRGCLLLLEQEVASRYVQRALDVGTGSGVLAIALAKLGLDEVWAIDTDAVACAIADANVACNGVETQVHIRRSLDEIRGAFDLITANLYANLLADLAAQLIRLLAAGGLLICSGFLGTDERRLCSAYESQGLHLVRRHEEQSWVTLALRCPPQA